jgi:pimeloyl-ACP methyl ester carboxylesterase
MTVAPLNDGRSHEPAYDCRTQFSSVPISPAIALIRADHIVEVLRHRLDYLKWREGIGSVRDWQLSESPACPVKAIHGSHDRIIPLNRIPRPDVVVPGGSHLLNLTHPTAVNTFLREQLIEGLG